jgi:hypothetical protein
MKTPKPFEPSMLERVRSWRRRAAERWRGKSAAEWAAHERELLNATGLDGLPRGGDKAGSPPAKRAAG